jgi:hypothetical protein
MINPLGITFRVQYEFFSISKRAFLVSSMLCISQMQPEARDFGVLSQLFECNGRNIDNSPSLLYWGVTLLIATNLLTPT